jgi:hypothetical protein
VISHDPDARFRAYTESQFRFEHPSLGRINVRPDASGRCTGEYPLDEGTTVHVITAHNPGRVLPPAQNDERHARLGKWVAGCPDLTVWPAMGGNPDWSHTEDSFAIVGLTDADACALGREFEQEAIFAWRADELVVAGCDEAASASMGWIASRG